MPAPAKTSIIESAAEYVSDLLTTRLPDQYVYHTLSRTTEVVRGEILERPLERLQHLAERAGGRRARATRGDGGTPAAAVR